MNKERKILKTAKNQLESTRKLQKKSKYYYNLQKKTLKTTYKNYHKPFLGDKKSQNCLVVGKISISPKLQ